MAERLLALGVDAGGTKTDAVVCDTAGAVRGFGTSGRGNWEYDGLESRVCLARRGRGCRARRGGRSPRSDRLSVFALAGLDWPIDCDRLQPVVAGLALGGPRPRQRRVRGAARGVPRRARRGVDRRDGIGHGGAQQGRADVPHHGARLRRARRRVGPRARGARRDRADASRAGPADAARGALPRRPRPLDDRRAVRGDLTPRTAACRPSSRPSSCTPPPMATRRRQPSRSRWEEPRGRGGRRRADPRDAGRRLRGRVRGRGARRGERGPRLGVPCGAVGELPGLDTRRADGDRRQSGRRSSRSNVSRTSTQPCTTDCSARSPVPSSFHERADPHAAGDRGAAGSGRRDPACARRAGGRAGGRDAQARRRPGRPDRARQLGPRGDLRAVPARRTLRHRDRARGAEPVHHVRRARRPARGARDRRLAVGRDADRLGPGVCRVSRRVDGGRDQRGAGRRSRAASTTPS